MRRFSALSALLLVCLLAVAPPALSKPPKQHACNVETFEYDTGGDPGAGAVDDPLFARQWGLEQIHAPEAWARGFTGSGAVIAVVDTGVDLVHPDLQAHLSGGEDVAAGRNDCPPGPQDENGHGTHVAGIAAAVTDNGIGVAGTAPDARIMPVRVLDETGSAPIEDVVEGIRFAADQGADVINLSLGELPIIGQLPMLNEEIEEAVTYAYERGATIVAAAGNETFPLCSYPAAASKAICVGATDSRGLPTFYSNFPNDDDALGVRAPGGVGSPFCEDDEDIWSTMWPGSDLDCPGIAGYDTIAGTSMATPFVAGVAALLAADGLTNDEIYERIRTTSSNGGTFDPVFGYGIVDANAATGG